MKQQGSIIVLRLIMAFFVTIMFLTSFSVKTSWSSEEAVCEGDFDYDGDVDGSDLAIFAADFGRTNCQHNDLMPAFRVDTPFIVKVAVSKMLYDNSLTMGSYAKEIWDEDFGQCDLGEARIVKSDEGASGFSAGDTITINFDNCLTYEYDEDNDYTMMDGRMVWKVLAYDEPNMGVKVSGSWFQESDRNEVNTYFDFDAETSFNFETEQYQFICSKLLYETNAQTYLRIRFETPAAIIGHRAGGADHDTFLSGTMVIIGGGNSKITITLTGGGLDDPLPILIDENGDGSPEGTVQTTLRELVDLD
jgi:hypothetical protein